MAGCQHPTANPSTSSQGLPGKRWAAGEDTQGTHRSPCPASGRRCCASHPGSSRRWVSTGTLPEGGRPLYRTEVDLSTHHPVPGPPCQPPGTGWHWQCSSPPSPRSSPTLGHCLLEEEDTGEGGGPHAGELNVGVQLEDGVHVEATGPAVSEVLPPAGGTWGQTSASPLAKPPWPWWASIPMSLLSLVSLLPCLQLLPPMLLEDLQLIVRQLLPWKGGERGQGRTAPPS